MSQDDTQWVCRALETALRLQAGLRAWRATDLDVTEPRLRKAFRDNWDIRVGGEKFGGVFAIAKAKANPGHPASKEALRIPRCEWTGTTVTVEHAIPVRVMFDLFWNAHTEADMLEIIRAYAVAVVTREEDKRLREAGLGLAMPDGWRFGDDPLARWRMVGIEVDLRSTPDCTD